MRNFLLAAIALGVWINVALAFQQSEALSKIESSASSADELGRRDRIRKLQ